MSLKLPSFPFYPGDWLRDNVAGCSLAAQGLWLRMMMLGHESGRYGYLEVDGSPMQPTLIARLCGCADLAQYETLLSELADAGVPSRTPNGVIYSRRMARDAQERAVAAERQRRKREKKCHGTVTDAVTPLSESESEEGGTSDGVLEKQLETLYGKYPRKVGKNHAIKAMRTALKKVNYGVLLEAVTAYANAREGEDQQYTPYPATWFNAERWNDDRSNWKSNGRKGGTKPGDGQAYNPNAEGTF